MGLADLLCGRKAVSPEMGIVSQPSVNEYEVERGSIKIAGFLGDRLSVGGT